MHCKIMTGKHCLYSPYTSWLFRISQVDFLIHTCLVWVHFYVSLFFFDNQVVLRDLEVLAEIVSSSAGLGFVADQQSTNQITQSASSASFKAVTGTNKYFEEFTKKLLDLFNTDRQLLEGRGSFIIR